LIDAALHLILDAKCSLQAIAEILNHQRVFHARNLDQIPQSVPKSKACFHCVHESKIHVVVPLPCKQSSNSLQMHTVAICAF
ncbi:hypothetical protein T4B_6626, partial [Trichinella pseudospiralis]